MIVLQVQTTVELQNSAYNYLVSITVPYNINCNWFICERKWDQRILVMRV